MLTAILLTLLAQAAPGPFTDADLHRAEKKGDALVYAWSPHMNLSVRGLDQALARERHGGPHVIAVLDPACNRALARKIARTHGWPEEALRENASDELIGRGFRVHYPSYLFLSGGSSIGPVIPGYKTEKELAWFRQHSQR